MWSQFRPNLSCVGGTSFPVVLLCAEIVLGDTYLPYILLVVVSMMCVVFVFCPPTDEQATVPFFFGRNFFQFPTDGQTTVPFFPSVIFSGYNLNQINLYLKRFQYSICIRSI